MNPEFDLGIDRIIRAPRKHVWDAWTDPANLAQWWVPAPTRCRVERLDVRPGGAGPAGRGRGRMMKAAVRNSSPSTA